MIVSASAKLKLHAKGKKTGKRKRDVQSAAGSLHPSFQSSDMMSLVRRTREFVLQFILPDVQRRLCCVRNDGTVHVSCTPLAMAHGHCMCSVGRRRSAAACVQICQVSALGLSRAVRARFNLTYRVVLGQRARIMFVSSAGACAFSNIKHRRERKEPLDRTMHEGKQSESSHIHACSSVLRF